ncbi:MAG: N-acetylmuramoyl-L-alanine amidase, partial [Ilumatobacteraceae bacterium]
MVHSALTTRFAVTSDYSSRGGVKVDSIGHHHAAGTSLEVALSLFQPGGRTVSPNYCIRGKDIVLVVPEEFRAWTSSDAWADARSITYEIVNSGGDPLWPFDPDTIASVIALDADISRRYGITPRHAIPGFWQHRNLYEWYGRSYATACAGPSFDINYIIDAVLRGVVVPPEGVEDMASLSAIVADSAGSLWFVDAQTGVRKVSDFVDAQMDNATVVDSLNDAFGHYHTPDSQWAFNVLTALIERHAADFQADLVDKIAAK